MTRRLLAPLLLLLLLLAGGFDAGPAAAEDADAKAARKRWKRARRGWNAARKEKSFAVRRAALTEVAACGTPEALALLLEIAAGTKHRGGEHFDQIVVSVIASKFPFAPHARTYLKAFAETHAEPRHAWLAYRVFTAKPSTSQDQALLAALPALEHAPYHHAAAVRALAARRKPAFVAVATRTLEDLPQDPALRAVRIEAAAAVLAANATKGWDDPAARKHIETLIGMLALEGLPPRSRLAIGRTLARLLDTDIAYADAASWNKHLGKEEEKARLKKEGYAVREEERPTFLGIKSLGRDIVYVIDISGSMTAETAFEALGRPRKPGDRRRGGGPLTGESEREAKDRDAKQKGREAFDPFASLDDVDPKKIRTRMDLMKEALKASVRRLQPHQRFAVVIFGSDARLLLTSDGLVKATKLNVTSALKRIHGLGAFGQTNVHRGLELAFRMPAADDGPPVYVDPSALLNGADTVFLLSDGAPSEDSYSPGEETFFARRRQVVEAVKRWNLFRDCEIHTIGFKAGPMRLLKDLAKVGRGRFVDLGL